MNRHALLFLALAAGCCPSGEIPKTPPASDLPPLEGAGAPEPHLADVRQLTAGGENAEAYWSFDGTQLVFQATPPGQGCDQIYRMPPSGDGKPVRVSSGEGATTCSYFLPGDQRILYASTHLAGPGCPPKPDRSQGYVWPIYDSYDIFVVPVEGGEPQRLTDTPGYDAEATVCTKDGSILFTSVRDGDLELYRMDSDGKNVKRLTHQLGYDGGGFFNQDCSRIVWRASRPTGEAAADYQRLLKENLVRPTKLELYVANADGSDPQQVTYLNAASFAPFFFPDGKRILFSSNVGDPKGREFDIWAIDADGTDLERITTASGFDGFPMFSPDGSLLAFASNRATAAGAHDTNLFVARWVADPVRPDRELAADRTWRDVAWLSDPAREGRGIGTVGLEAAGAYLERRMTELGLSGAFEGSFRQSFDVPVAVHERKETELVVGEATVSASDRGLLPGSGQGHAEGALVFAGYGIVSKQLGIDDYAKLDVEGKVALVRRFVPASVTDDDAKRRLSDLRYKAWLAKERGAVGMLVVDAPPTGKKGEDPPDEAPFPELSISGYGDAGLPMLIVKRAIGSGWIGELGRKRALRATLTVSLQQTKRAAFNVGGRLAADVPVAQRLPGVVVVGAHYDHLGMGGPGSLAPDSRAPHLGADDNASGVAALLEAARNLSRTKGRSRDVLFVAFSGEESGVLGSSHFVAHLPAGLSAASVVAMVNMDMVGRMRNNQLLALGGDSATEWKALVHAACDEARIECSAKGDGYGPSDHSPFYAAGVPVLHLFTGAHEDYHKPSDSLERINAAGMGQVATVAASLARTLSRRKARLTYRKVPAPPPSGDLRSYGASLGTIPDYAGPPKGTDGVLLAGVRAGGAAERAGIQRGDILVQLSSHHIANVRDFMYALGALKPGQTVRAVVLRDGKKVELDVTLQKSQRRPR